MSRTNVGEEATTGSDLGLRVAMGRREKKQTDSDSLSSGSPLLPWDQQGALVVVVQLLECLRI